MWYAMIYHSTASHHIASSHATPAFAMAVFRTKILHVYGFDPIRILFSRGEIPQHTGDYPGNLTRRILVCEMLVQTMAVRTGPHPAGELPEPRVGAGKAEFALGGIFGFRIRPVPGHLLGEHKFNKMCLI